MDIGELIGPKSGLVLVVLAVFGYFYDKVIDWLARNHYSEGYVSFLVAFGAAVTLGGVAVVDLEAAVICAVAFVASGAPMIIGDLVRWAKARQRLRRLDG